MRRVREAPKLLEQTEPLYYEWLRRARKEGQVILEAIISADGCVQDVEVQKSADPALDLDGRPSRDAVEVSTGDARWQDRCAFILTVTFTFRLNTE